MVHSAAQLIRRKGVSGTGMREIVIEADAPRGSLQHYFPGGKEELVSDALLWMGDVAAQRIRRCLSELETRTPSALLASIVENWQRDLTREKFSAGCPLVAAAADTAGTSTSSAKCSDVHSTVGSNRSLRVWSSSACPSSAPTISPS